MADGGRASSRKQDWEFTHWERAEIDWAAKRLARAFGYGPSWNSPTMDVIEFEDMSSSEHLRLFRRGNVVEQAARRIDGSGHVNRQRSWSAYGGKVTAPFVSPDSLGQASLSFARFSGPLLPLLKAYAFEDFSEWPNIERHLAKQLPHLQGFIHACALERLIWGAKGSMPPRKNKCFDTPRKVSDVAPPFADRAKQLKMRAETFRHCVQQSQGVLSKWLLRAAQLYNSTANARASRIGHNHATAFRSDLLWHPKRYTQSPCITVSAQHVAAFPSHGRFELQNNWTGRQP